MGTPSGRVVGPGSGGALPATRYQWLARFFLGLFVVTVMGAVAYAVWRDREVQLEQQMARAQGNALIFEDEIGQALQLIENTLRALPEVSGEPLAEASPERLMGVLRRLQYSQPAVRSLSILDRAGQVRASSQPANLGQVVDTLGFLPVDRASGNASALRVGPVWEGRDLRGARPTLADQPGDPSLPYFVPLVMRMGEGEQAVWLLAALNPDYLLGRMERFHREDSDRVHVVRLDGRVLFSTDEGPNGMRYPFASLLPTILTNELGTDDGESEGGSAFTSYRTLKTYPVFVSVRVDRAAVLRDWRRKSALIAAVTALGLVSVLAGYLWLMRRLRAAEQADALQQATIVRLSQALEQSPSGMQIVNEQGRIEYSNPFLCQMTGYSAAELLGRTPAVLDDSPEKERYLDVLEQLKSGHIWRGEVVRRRRDGHRYPAHVVVAPLRDVRGRITHFVTVEHDLTQEKRTLAELAQARDRAEAATRAKSAFLANMSHEIRTPMNGVIGMVSLLLDSPLSAEQRDQALTMRESAESLLHLIDDILDFSKVEAGKLVLSVQALSPAELCRACVRRMELSAQDKGLLLLLELSPDLPPAVLGDAQRIQQVLVNLVGNAIKFTANGKVVLRVNPLLCDAASPERAGLRFEVQDEGIGIAADAQYQLFQPFTQIDGSSSRAFGGTGLGLSISRQLIEAMGGRIGVDSAAGQGATFWFELSLPLVPAEVMASNAQPEGAAAPVPALVPLAGRVLLVEDQPVNQKLALAVLARVGLQTALARNGHEALALLREQTFDLVLMDCQMPEMDGFEATEHLRAGKAGEAARSLPVLALTANVMAEDLERCRVSGFNGHVAKPFSMKDLHTALLPWLRA